MLGLNLANCSSLNKSQNSTPLNTQNKTIISQPISDDLRYAKSQFNAGNYPVAEYYFKKSIFQYANNPLAVKLLPWAYFYQGKFDRALIAFSHASTHFPRDPEPLIGLGWAYFSMQFYELAMDSFNKAEEKSGDPYEIHKGKGFTNLMMKNEEEALAHFSKVYTVPETAKIMAQWGEWKKQLPEKLFEIIPGKSSESSLFTLKAEYPRYRSMLMGLWAGQERKPLDEAWRFFRRKSYKRAFRAFSKTPPAETQSLDHLNGLAWTYLRNGDIQEAKRRFAGLRTVYPNFPGVAEGIKEVETAMMRKASFAKHYLKLEKLLIAEEKARELQARHPNWSLPHGLMGQVRLAQNNFDDAGKLFDKALLLDPNDETALTGLKEMEKKLTPRISKGKEALAKKDYKKASYYFWDFIDEYRDAPMTNSMAEAYNGLGWSQIGKGDYPLAIGKFQKIRPVTGYQFKAVKGIGLASYHLGDYAKAVEFLQTADNLVPDQKEIYEPLGWSVLEVFELREAEKYFREKTFKKPLRPSSYMALGWIYHRMGNPDLGVEYFLKSISVDPEVALTPEFKKMLDKQRFGWQVVNSIGWAYYHRGQYKRSMEFFQIALGIRPESSQAMKGMGYNHFKLGNHSEAETFFIRSLTRNSKPVPVIEIIEEENSISLFEKETSVRTKLGQIYFEQKRYREALIQFKKTAARFPNWTEVNNAMGWAYIKLNRLMEARTAFNQAIRYQPLNYQAHKGLAETKHLLATLKWNEMRRNQASFDEELPGSLLKE